MSKVHIVKQGECLASIAKKYGFKNWKTIYGHPENKDFSEKRKNPNVIYPGDKIFIPDKQSELKNINTDKTYRIKIKTQKTFLKVIIKNEEGNPVSNTQYELKVRNTTVIGTTGSDGLLVKEIPVDAEEGQLTIFTPNKYGDKFTWTLKIGHLDPIEEITGVQARLTNIGYGCGAIDGVIGPHTEAAIKIFQRKNGLTPNGQLNEETRSKLKEVYGC